MIKKLNKLIGRPLFEDERAMVYKWYDTWDFDRDVILYAFDVTTNRITQTSHYIRYMDAMLQSWKDDGLNSLDEIKASVGQKENVKVNYRNVQRHVLFEREPVYIRYGLADVKPCPFCGEQPEIENVKDYKEKVVGKCIICRNHNCGVTVVTKSVSNFEKLVNEIFALFIKQVKDDLFDLLFNFYNKIQV